MLLGETFKALLLVGACLSAQAAPLGATSSPQARRCVRIEQASKETSENLESPHDEKLCAISTMQMPASSSHIQEWQEPDRTADVLDNARDEGEVTVTDAGKVKITDSGLFQKTGRQNLLLSTPTESVSVRGRSSGPGNVNTEGESVTATSAADQINSQNDTVRKVGPSVVPFGQSTGRSAETQVVLGHSDYVRQGSLLYTDLDEDKGRVQPRTRDLPQEHEGGWDVEPITIKHSAPLSLSEPSSVVSSTAHDSTSQSPWTVINPVATSLTTSGSTDGEAGVAEENLFTASDLQDKALTPGLLQPDLTLSSREPDLGGTWTEQLHLQGVEETSVLPLSQEVGTEATMSSEDLPLIFEPLDDVTPPSGSILASELSVAMAPATGMLREAEPEQTVSVDTEHVPPDASVLGPSDWPPPWQMSGSENSDAVVPYQMPDSKPFSGANLGPRERTERLQNFSVSVGTLPLSTSPTTAITQQDIEPTQSLVLQTKSGLDELESEEDEDEEDEDVDESEEEEEDSEEDLNEATVHTPTRPSYSLIPPPPVWGHQNQGLIRSWVELIREKAGYVSGMLVPVGIGIAGALLIVGALYSIRMIHRKRKNSFKHQRRKQPKEVRSGPDQAMLLADSSEDEF